VKSKRLVIPGTLAHLHEAVEALEEFGREAGAPPDAVRALALALDEVLVNVIQYACEGEGAVEVQLEHDEGRLAVDVVDHGRPFDPTLAKPPDPDALASEHAESGRGIFLVRSSVDEFTYRRAGGANRVRLVKRL